MYGARGEIVGDHPYKLNIRVIVRSYTKRKKKHMIFPLSHTHTHAVCYVHKPMTTVCANKIHANKSKIQVYVYKN